MSKMPQQGTAEDNFVWLGHGLKIDSPRCSSNLEILYCSRGWGAGGPRLQRGLGRHVGVSTDLLASCSESGSESGSESVSCTKAPLLSRTVVKSSPDGCLEPDSQTTGSLWKSRQDMSIHPSGAWADLCSGAVNPPCSWPRSGSPGPRCCWLARMTSMNSAS